MKIVRYAVFALAAVTLVACGSAPKTNLYTLSPGDLAPNTRQVGPVTMGQVTLPNILDRNQLVIRPTLTSIDIRQFDRWAAPLDENIAATLNVDLERILPPGALVRSNGSPFDTAIGIVNLYVDRFDSDGAGHVTFDVAWTVTSGNPQKTILRRTEHITEDAGDASSPAIVAAMSQAVSDLAAKIAAQLP